MRTATAGHSVGGTEERRVDVIRDQLHRPFSLFPQREEAPVGAAAQSRQKDEGGKSTFSLYFDAQILLSCFTLEKSIQKPGMKPSRRGPQPFCYQGPVLL